MTQPPPLSVEHPGAAPLPAETRAELLAAWATRPKDYVPRTRHLEPDGRPRFTNRLFLESSPYLRQHAHNPVNWQAWSDAAFEEARREGKPVLLSVGYSTCHWCHVMEEESFEDPDIAALMNQLYVPIKVDREERPDVDSIYMTAVQALTGHGGWPMTVWLTPEREPFYAGTYFPPRAGARGARVGFDSLLQQLRAAWDRDREGVAATAGRIAEELRRMLNQPSGDDVPSAAVLDAATTGFARRFDARYGGVSGAPKFPSSMPVRLLVRRLAARPELHDVIAGTLDGMAQGGIRDHVAGGFHRYSTDEQWLVPHFEKMLYDNALLTLSYLDAARVLGRPDWTFVARDTLAWIEREMTSPEGAFYSATDADSLTPSGEREEGWYFSWTPAELEATLGAADARVAADWFAVTTEGNFEGRNVLSTPHARADVAGVLGIDEAALEARLAAIRSCLLAARATRPAPLRDDKILTAWNALTISAFARAGFDTQDTALVDRAVRAARYLLEHGRDGDGVARSISGGKPKHRGVLDDHAFLAAALLDLFEATGEREWLRQAIELDRVIERRFEDREHGGFFLAAADGEALIAREKPSHDGAEPSGASVHTLTLLRLAALSADDRYRARADGALRAAAPTLAKMPMALSEMLLALDWRHGRPLELLLVAPRQRTELDELLDVVRRSPVSNRVLVTAIAEDLDALARLVPWVAGKQPVDGRPTAYVCERGACQLPVTSAADLACRLDELR